MAEIAFQPGHVFFRPDDPADRAYLLVAGEVELLVAGRRVAVFAPGDVFGEMSLIEERPHRMTARATAAGRAETLTREEFEDGLLRDPARCRAYLVSLFERLRGLAAGGDPPADAAAPDRVTIVPLTPAAARGVPEAGLAVPRFPFRIGRASSHALDKNDLDLPDDRPHTVSRSHCQLELDPAGGVRVRDRGSHLGTVVNDALIGGPDETTTAPLRPGDNTLVLGGHGSPFRFRVAVEAAP
ncbi:MAG: cyclic nucleotide-binding domain-containing protein [Gemmataceae bacterium]